MHRRVAPRALTVLAVAIFIAAMPALSAGASSDSSGYNYYYTWGNTPEEIICGRGESSWGDAQAQPTSPIDFLVAQQVSVKPLFCPDPFGMDANYQYAEGSMLRWNSGSWSLCKSLTRIYNGQGGSSANSVRPSASLCGVGTYTLQGHYGIAWFFAWHDGWTYTPNRVFY